MGTMTDAYQVWLGQVEVALNSINMQMQDWQNVWAFDFVSQFDAGKKPDEAAMKANRFWWRQQNRSLSRDCQNVPGCWLPSGHQGNCQPYYESGDYVKAEFPDKTTGIGEWMWLRVESNDEEKQVVFGRLDNDPLNDYGERVMLGSQLAVSYSNIRDYKRASEFQST